MTRNSRTTDSTDPNPPSAPETDEARAPWTAPEVRELPFADTEGGADGDPMEGTFYGPFS